MTVSARTLDKLGSGRERFDLSDDEWRDLLRRWGGVDTVEQLDEDAAERVIDRLIAAGCRDLADPPVVGLDYRQLIHDWAEHLEMADDEIAALRNACGAPERGHVSGDAFRRLFVYFYGRGCDVSGLTRRVVTKRQIALLQVARKQVGLDDDQFENILRNTGGALSVNNLDKTGIRRVLVHLESLGFEPPAKRATFGRRAGMATPEQVQLVRRLWRDYTGAEDDTGLDAWIERSFKVTTLRFATAAIAGKAITGLRAMIGRRKTDRVA